MRILTHDIKNLTRIFVILLIGFVIYFLWGQLQSMQASVEEVALNYNLSTLKRLFSLKERIDSGLGLPIQKRFQALPSFLETMGFDVLKVKKSLKTIPIGRWVYYIDSNEVRYQVRSKDYFRTISQKPYLTIQFIEIKGKIEMSLSAFQWCVEKKWWGCGKW
jgi:hypothetical protein